MSILYINLTRATYISLPHAKVFFEPVKMIHGYMDNNF
ncbi:hypothetical protein FACI_IFERC00001G1714 [Ferroplasma acidarmanus Fer1]|uniref:Uncharacterized protein n=1 Tax=Ferroplasma acidarmanus Fer1 TaxID=333146 RepID=S0ATX2_FERAC|nr:hypothetical protein FACI_IFERC00001G1714 [Ferroplasma acidarmanus Fer1]